MTDRDGNSGTDTAQTILAVAAITGMLTLIGVNLIRML